MQINDTKNQSFCKMCTKAQNVNGLNDMLGIAKGNNL